MAKTSGGVRGSKSESKLSKQLRITERTIRRNTYESAIVLNSKGHIVLNKGGAKYSVAFTQEEIDKMKNMVLTHNHPRALGKTGMAAIGNSFSMEDITLAVHANVKEIRAVTPTYTFSMKRPANGWGISHKKAAQIFNEINKEVEREYTSRIKKGTATPLQAQTVHFHEVSKRIAKKLGWLYTKKKG